MSHTASGKVAAPTIDPIEMCLVHATTTVNTTSTAPSATGVRQRKAPTKLATALPPLKLQNPGVGAPPHHSQARQARPRRAAVREPPGDPHRQVSLADI